jgi:hypothetical protein
MCLLENVPLSLPTEESTMNEPTGPLSLELPSALGDAAGRRYYIGITAMRDDMKIYEAIRQSRLNMK